MFIAILGSASGIILQDIFPPVFVSENRCDSEIKLMLLDPTQQLVSICLQHFLQQEISANCHANNTAGAE